MRKKLVLGSVQNQKYLRIPSQITLRMYVYPRRFVIVPLQKREELVKILDDTIKRLLKLINARKTETRVRLKALTVLNELIQTSYTMVREVEELERETEKLEKEAKRTETEDNAEEEPAKLASYIGKIKNSDGNPNTNQTILRKSEHIMKGIILHGGTEQDSDP